MCVRPPMILRSGREKARYQKRELGKQASALIDLLERLNGQLSSAQPELVIVAEAMPVETGEGAPPRGDGEAAAPPLVLTGEVVLEEVDVAVVVAGEWVD